MTDLWHGGLKLTRNPNVKVFFAILFFPFIFALEFKSKEELSLQPQTSKENKRKRAEIELAKETESMLEEQLTDIEDTGSKDDKRAVAKKYLKVSR